MSIKDHTVTVAWSPRQEDLQIIIPTRRVSVGIGALTVRVRVRIEYNYIN